MKTLILTAVLAAPAAMADCRLATVPEQPQVPDGAVASLQEMQLAHKAVAEYVNGTQTYLECHKLAYHYHDYLVNQMDSVASSFNAQRQSYMSQLDMSQFDVLAAN